MKVYFLTRFTQLISNKCYCYASNTICRQFFQLDFFPLRLKFFSLIMHSIECMLLLSNPHKITDIFNIHVVKFNYAFYQHFLKKNI